MSDKHPTENSTALIVGGEIKTVGFFVAGKLFVFTSSQTQFLLNLQKLKNTTAAALSVDKDDAWGKAFLASRKFKDYIACKMQEFSVKNGLTVEWWYQFGKWLTEGKKEFYEVSCTHCDFSSKSTQYEIETCRDDDGAVVMSCPVCFGAVKANAVTEAFRPTREMVEGWKELGARLIPKIERVHNTFENVEISFESTEG